MSLGRFHRIVIAGRKLLLFAIIATAPSRANGVNHHPGRQIIRRTYDHIPRRVMGSV
jgi:methyl coenzyme M reductase subunit D